MWSLIIPLAYFSTVGFITILSFRLGKTKTDNATTAGLIGFFLALFPPFGLVYLAVLALKEEAGTV